jgi:hypothetical protein
VTGDEAYDELFSAPVEDFVSLRDALVKQLKAVGDKDQAAVVKGWRRPSRVVGALNRLALTDADVAAEFADAALAVASSRGPGLREANESFRAAVKRAAAAAVDALDQARPSDLGEITSGLLTIGADTDALDTFREGRLLDLPDAGQGGFGFGLGLDLTAEPAPSKPQKPKRATTRKQSAADREDELAERRRRAERARLEAAVDEASAAVRDAEEAVAAAEEQADETRRVRDEAQAALEAAEGEVEAAAAAAATAKQALADAEAALDG